MKTSLVILLLLLSVNFTFAQEKVYQISFSSHLAAETGRADSAGLVLAARKIKNQLLAEGYLLANIDQLDFAADTLRAQIYVGERYRWAALGVSNIPEEMLSKAGYRQRDFDGVTFSGRAFNRLVSKLLGLAANNGYPFANLQLQHVSIRGTHLKAILRYEPGPVINYDTLAIAPAGLIKREFLENYLHLRPGTPFQLPQVENIANAINRLPYCRLVDSTRLKFANNLCAISLQVAPVKANKIDALLGFLPNQTNDNGLLLTGYVNLHLQNLFRSGKELSFVWRQFKQESQKLYFLYRHPNLLRSPVGLQVNFNLLKQDSSFLNTDFTLAGFYQQKKTEVAFTAVFKSSRALAITRDSLAVPEFADFTLRQLGARVTYSGLGNTINPRQGAKGYVEVKVGGKKIKPDPRVAEAVYDSINLAPAQMEVTVGGEVNQRLTGPLVAHIDASYGQVLNNDQLFTNDLLRLGGVNSLRGFNELDIFVSTYLLARLEARIIMNMNSRVFVFYDQAFTWNNVGNSRDTPFGFGAGMVLDTGAGELQLVYALGVSAQQSLSLSQSKIHIGYVARF